MASIRQLSPRVVNKIAAGEVIERPASVVKELIENAVDSGATRVDVTVEQGGTESITVSDNGCGIPSGELKLAVTCHATSKIQDADDLFRVATLGFRGEALASIAEVSQLSLRSRIADCHEGTELKVDGGQVSGPIPCGCPPGTVVSVKNLFFNTPVRRKFLRSQQTEMGHCSEALTRVALAYPDIHFTLRNNGRMVQELPAAKSWRDRIASLFGPEIAEVLIDVKQVDGAIQLEGFVAAPSQSRSNNRLQYVLLNGRYIRDRSLQHALSEAYRGLLMVGRYPIAFLRLNMAPDQVDVNVHPTKLEVRFQDGGDVYRELLGALRARFLKSDLTHSLEQPSPRAIHESPATTPSHSATKREQINHWASQLHGNSPASVPTQTAPGTRMPDNQQGNFHFSPVPHNTMSTGQLNDSSGKQSPETTLPQNLPPSRLSPDSHSKSQINNVTPHPGMAIQVHNCYLVTETEDGLVVIDQHALHERILYEQLRNKILAGKVETQKLLVPEPVDLRPPEAAAVIEAQELLAEMGIDVQDFGKGTILVSGYPAMLTKVNPTELLHQIVDLLLAASPETTSTSDTSRTPERRDVLDRLLHMISCKAAIKAGDSLSTEEITALIQQRDLVQDSHHCPHGRPTSLALSKQELDRKFGRV